MTVTNKALDLSAGGLDPNGALGLVAIEDVTSTEQTLTITPHPAKPIKLRLFSVDQTWGISRVTGAYATKFERKINIELELNIAPGVTPIVLYWMASGTTAKVHVVAQN